MRGAFLGVTIVFLINFIISKAVEIKEICLTSPREIEIFTGVSLENDNFKIEICYPQITDRRIHTKEIINKYIYEKVKIIAENEVSFLNESYQSLSEDEKRALGNSFEFNLDYRIGFSSNSFFSGYIQSYVYAGGAHGAFEYYYINLDVTTNKNLEFFDIFKRNSVRQIREMIVKNGEREISSPEDFLDSDEPLNFYLDKNGNFVFTLAPYEYGPFAAGFREFPISYQNLEEFMNEGSTLYKLLFRR